MSDPSNSSDRVGGQVPDVADEVLGDHDLRDGGRADQVIADVKDVVDDAAGHVTATAENIDGKIVLFGVVAVAMAGGLSWIAYRMAKRTVTHHPAVRVARAGVHAVRERRGRH